MRGVAEGAKMWRQGDEGKLGLLQRKNHI